MYTNIHAHANGGQTLVKNICLWPVHGDWYCATVCALYHMA
jgi:hypothetical protein